MKMPINIQKIITKEGIPYKELKDIITDATVVIDDDTSKIMIDKLTFPVNLTDEETFEFIEFFYLDEYDSGVRISMYDVPNEILIENDNHFGGFMLAFVGILFLGVFAFMIMVSR
jgi:hypothetical protein